MKESHTILNKAELNNESAKFAGTYVERAFRKGRETEKHLVLNCVAHGFYMGARHYETAVMAPNFFRRLLGCKPLDDTALWNESVKAANYYLRRRGYWGKLPMSELALMRSTLSYGFREGYLWRRNHSA